MCGINGIVSSKAIDFEGSIRKMNSRMAHRGPDDEGVYIADQVAFGHRRLKIIDLSQAGHQPMQTSDGRYVVVFNGEIYNFNQIKQQLNYPFMSSTDTEVILAAWQKWGVECIHKFNGMFAIAIWDNLDNELFLVRDRLGIKPLYWYHDKGKLVFSSEIRSLLAGGVVPNCLDEAALVDYLRYQTVHAPHTILQNVSMLQAGSYLNYKPKDDRVLIKTYWKPEIKALHGSIGYQDIKEQVRSLFFKAVERRLVSDVPFGAFLSGGIDSSAVVGAMARVSSQPVKTFNISFAEEDFSEAKYARYIANMHQTDHTEIKLSPNDFLHHLPKALGEMDHPSGDGPNTWLVSKVTKEAGITMALSGLGGDELFAGYAIFKRMASLQKNNWLWHIPKPARKAAALLLCKVKPDVSSLKIKELLGMEAYDFSRSYAFSRQALMDDQIKGLINGNAMPDHWPVEVLHPLILSNKNHLLSNVSIGELTTYMQNVLLGDSDQMSMAHALEVRVPFLDHELVEYALAIPDQFKYPSQPKKLLVDSLSELLPDYIVNRPKMGFTFPWRDWLKNELYDFANERIQSIAQRDLFNQQQVIKLWERFNQGDPSVTFSRIWPMVVLEEWLGQNG